MYFIAMGSRETGEGEHYFVSSFCGKGSSPYLRAPVIKVLSAHCGSPACAKAIARERRVKAEVAHLVEHNLAKVGVAGSSPVFRSSYFPRLLAQRKPHPGLLCYRYYW